MAKELEKHSAALQQLRAQREEEETELEALRKELEHLPVQARKLAMDVEALTKQSADLKARLKQLQPQVPLPSNRTSLVICRAELTSIFFLLSIGSADGRGGGVSCSTREADHQRRAGGKEDRGGSCRGEGRGDRTRESYRRCRWRQAETPEGQVRGRHQGRGRSATQDQPRQSALDFGQEGIHTSSRTVMDPPLSATLSADPAGLRGLVRNSQHSRRRSRSWPRQRRTWPISKPSCRSSTTRRAMSKRPTNRCKPSTRRKKRRSRPPNRTSRR